MKTCVLNAQMPRWILPALLAAALPAAAVLAQAPTQPQASRASPRLSADTLKRLQDGRFAMIKETLKLNDAQLKLWEPVEAQMRSAAAARQQLREERSKRRAEGAVAPSLPDRLDLASQRMAQRAAQMKAFAEVFKPFYASLGEEQKAVADVVLRQMRGGFGGRGRHWAMRHAPGAPQ